MLSNLFSRVVDLYCMESSSSESLLSSKYQLNFPAASAASTAKLNVDTVHNDGYVMINGDLLGTNSSMLILNARPIAKMIAKFTSSVPNPISMIFCNSSYFNVELPNSLKWPSASERSKNSWESLYFLISNVWYTVATLTLLSQPESPMIPRAAYW